MQEKKKKSAKDFFLRGYFGKNPTLVKSKK